MGLSGRLGPGPAWSWARLGPWSLVPAWSRARLGPRSLVPWALVPWALVPGPWSQSVVPGPGPMVPGPWSLVPGPWSWSWSLAWSLAHGPWSWSLVPGPWSMVHGPGGPSDARVFHQSAPYESYGGIRTTIRRGISIRIILARSQVQLKPSWHQKSRKSESRLLIWARRGGVSEEFSRRCNSTVKSG